jgi:hypothetical protein
MHKNSGFDLVGAAVRIPAYVAAFGRAAKRNRLRA